MKSPLPYILARITRHPRHEVKLHRDFEWSDKSWTHNAFRLWELIFWRRCGPNGAGDTIRREAATYAFRDEDGIIHRWDAFYTKEAVVAHIETLVRETLSSFRLPRVRVYVPVLSPVGGMPAMIPTGFMLAIARDNNHYQNNTAASSGLSFSYTCTGSNLVLTDFCYSPTGSDAANMTATYKAVSMTAVGSTTSTHNSMKSFVLTGPATGANTLTMACTSGSVPAMAAVSYTGAAQSGQPDAHAETFGNNSNALSVNVVTVAANAWIAGFYYNGTGGAATASGSFVILHDGAGTVGSGDWSTLCVLDTNAAIAVPASTAVGCSKSGTTEVVLTAFSIAPSLAANTNAPFFINMVTQ